MYAYCLQKVLGGSAFGFIVDLDKLGYNNTFLKIMEGIKLIESTELYNMLQQGLNHSYLSDINYLLLIGKLS